VLTVDDLRIERLEQTIIELGAETHRLRKEVELCMETNRALEKKIYILKKVLNERAIVLEEDIEIAEELSEEEKKEVFAEDFRKKASSLKKVLQ